MKTTIKKAMNSYATDGSIFSALPVYGEATPQQVAIAYVLQHSGQKVTSALIDEYLDTNNHLTQDGITIISDILKSVFKSNWDKRYEAIISEYSPLENYHMEETGLEAKTGTDDLSMSRAEKTRTDNIGSTSGSSTTGSQNNTTQNDISAFNSGGFQDNTNTNQSIGQREDSYNTNSQINSSTTNKYIDNDTTTYNNNLNRTITRNGNIGVTTSQQMLKAELEIRSYNFYKQMFEDIDSYLALKIYSYSDDYETPNYDFVIPLISVKRVDNGVVVTAVDTNGTTTSKVLDGEDGVDGKSPEFKLEEGDLYVTYEQEG